MTPNKRDYYEVLGIGRGVDKDAVKRAFRRLALKYHPDTNTEDGAQARFIEINEAYETLSNPEKRAAYDRYGHAGLDGPGMSAGYGASSRTREDLYRPFCAAATGPQSATGTVRGADLRTALTIAFEEAVLGCQKAVELPRWESCSPCRGTGTQPGSTSRRCGTCQGTGEVRRVLQSLFGPFVTVATCERCRGQGRTTDTPCEHCQGSGREQVKRRVFVTIPAGVDDGTNVRVVGAGEAGPSGGPAGNLYVALTVTPHPHFLRRGNDILYELPMVRARAELGAVVEVPTVGGGSARLTVPAGTQDGRSFRLRGLGVPVVHGTARGDQYVIVRVVTHTTSARSRNP